MSESNRPNEVPKPLDPNRPFPLQRLGNSVQPRTSERASCPWWIAEIAYRDYSARYGRGQSLERMGERGGFCNSEMDDFFPEWRNVMDLQAEIESRGKRVTALEVQLGGDGTPAEQALEQAELKIEQLEREVSASHQLAKEGPRELIEGLELKIEQLEAEDPRADNRDLRENLDRSRAFRRCFPPGVDGLTARKMVGDRAVAEYQQSLRVHEREEG